MVDISFNIWAILILLGAVQAIFLAFVLILSPKNRIANRWLGALLLVISLNLLEYSFSMTGLAFYYPNIIAISYPFLFCMGPFYWFHIQYQLGYSNKFKKSDLLHFIIPLLSFVLLLPFYLLDESAKREFLDRIFYNGSVSIPVSQFLFMAAHLVQTFIYVFYSYRSISKLTGEFKEEQSNTLFEQKLSYLDTFTKTFLGWLLMFLLLLILLFALDSYLIQMDYVSVLITSVLIFVIAYSVLRNPQVFNESAKINENTTNSKYQTSALNDQEIKHITQSLTNYFEEDKPYLQHDLKLSDVAEMLSIPSHHLSQAINQELNLNFYEFVNNYRVDEAKKMLSQRNNNHLKILAVAFEVGFNSKSTFNRVFKEHTKLTPSEYRKRFSDFH